MPLHAERKVMLRRLERFDQTIRGMRHDMQARGNGPAGLMMEAVDHQGRPPGNAGQPAVRADLHRVRQQVKWIAGVICVAVRARMLADVPVQRPAARDVQHLQAATDA